MIAGPLTSRRTQLDLLASACTENRRARIVQSEPTHDRVVSNTRFVAMHEQGLDFEVPPGGIPDTLAPHAPIDIHFDEAGEPLALRTTSQGPADAAAGADAPPQVWRFALPLVIERRSRRSATRISLGGLGSIAASLADTNDPQIGLGAEIQNISAGGLGGLAALPDAARIRAGQLYWVRFELPTEPVAFEFVLRLVHAHEVSPSTVVWGGTFCAGEDPAAIREQLRRIECLVHSQTLAVRPPDSSSACAGDQPC